MRLKIAFASCGAVGSLDIGQRAPSARLMAHSLRLSGLPVVLKSGATGLDRAAEFKRMVL
jgi:hypothetical protein